jgi:BASS family bile acid:Na+ symporter
MGLVMPLFALAVAAFTGIPDPVKIALVALSAAPVPPLLPGKASKVSTAHDYAIGLMFVAALAAIAYVPLVFGIAGNLFGVNAHVPLATVVFVTSLTVLAPLAAGVVGRRFWPALAGRVARPIAIAAMTLLILSVLPVLVILIPRAVALAHDGSVAGVAGFVVVGLVAGYLLGGPDAEHRNVLSMAASWRHPGLALAVSSAAFPHEKNMIAAIGLYILVNFLVDSGVIVWRKAMRQPGRA